ncbi:hypothetical protein LPJ61_005345 [Coemansia biformis]|uniref:Uncharacterized protein n=1 Tax=Coemansia biformis TaxID=1286918 RepID=A0A9W7Y389_9FUNG|nr:hypothetical protein LPJ61_005345 [Coemansia biformis]
MIAPVDDTGTSARGATDGSAAVPPILAIGAPVQSLARKVHPSVLFQLVQLSLAYVYTLRHLNGETHGSNLAAAFTSLESVAPLLSAAVADIYQSAHEALIVGFSGIDENMDGYAKCSLLDDILAIYADHTHVAAMVSDIYRIVTDILGTRVSSAGSPARARVKRGEKRIFFLASIVKQMQGEADPWQFMAIDVAMLKRRYASEIQILESGSPTAPEPAENASDQAGGAEAKPQIQAL